MVASESKRPRRNPGPLLLRMRVRIVRTVARLPALPYASPKQPRRKVTARPYSAPRMISLALRTIVLAL